MCNNGSMSEEAIREGERTTLTSMASKGKLIRERYRLTSEYLYFDAGILSTKAEQIPTWAFRDVDVRQSIKQRAMGVGDVIVKCQHDDYTGRKVVEVEGVKDPKTVRDIMLQIGQKARLTYQQRSQTSYMNVSGGSVPLTNVPQANVVDKAEDPYERIAKLKQLLDGGAITQDEFEAQKARLLGSD